MPQDRARLTARANLGIGLCMLIGLAVSSLVSARLFQTVAELYFAGVAYSILIVAWNLRAFTSDDFAMLLARLLALAAVFELLRVISSPGLDLIPDAAPGMSLQFSIAAGFVLGGGFLLAPLAVRRRISEPPVVAAIVATGLLLLGSIVWFKVFPATIDAAGVATAFARLSPLCSGFALLGGVAMLHRRHAIVKSGLWRLLTLALLVMASWQFLLAAFPQPTRPQDVATHLLMITSAYLLYRAVAEAGLTVPVGLLLEHLKEDKERSEQHYQALFEQVPVGVATFNRDGRLSDCNSGFAKLAGASREVLLETCRERPCDPRILPSIESALTGATGNYEGPFRPLSGDERWISLRCEPLVNVGGADGCIAVLADMTEGKRNEELIERLAFTDELTGVANRTLLRDRLRQAIAAAERSRRQVAVASVNLDRFKSVNEGFGIASGDSLLQAVSTRLTELVRRGDTVCRSGGDQFILLLADVRRTSDVIAVADKIGDGFKKSWTVGEHQFHVTASIGVAVYPTDGLDAETLIEQAQTAMRRAKQDGGDCCQFYALSMNERAAERFAMETALRRALDEDAEHEDADGDQLLVHYQPQVQLESGRIIGIEALVRWHHPEFGMLPPLRFIPLAEETALIARLDRYVLRQACRQARAWQELVGRPFRLAVNLSARQFQRHDLLAVVEAALSDSGLSPECLELEITETVAMQSAERTARILSQLRSTGVSIALDDFGTGFSSLSHLRQLPINRLKVDCSFVANLEDDPGAAAIVKAVLGMGETLGIDVLAEGVETRAQAEYLIEAGCREAQGFLFARPLSPADCEEVLLANDLSRVG